MGRGPTDDWAGAGGRDRHSHTGLAWSRVELPTNIREVSQPLLKTVSRHEMKRPNFMSTKVSR